ncbi:uncharacterized protein LOC135484699 [Lineus longissimus]|uniref:uncharacterized protein LOC135484699 n=1 Tax=Lineus longissimus TaxID=88925 RepID=UPI002B4D1A2B
MASSNVEFYEKQQILQDSQHRCEQERMVLEQQLNSYSKSDARFGRLRAAKLQAYWKKLCEDEKRSRRRNEQTLKEFDRVEKHVRALHTKTENYAVMKKQYEEYIERMYPHWKEKVQQWQHKQEQAQEQQKQMANLKAQQAPSFTERFLVQKSPQVQFDVTPGQTGGYSSQSPYPRTHTHSVVGTKDNTMNQVQHFPQQPEAKFATPDSTSQNGYESLSQVTDLPLSTPRQTGLQNGDIKDGTKVVQRPASLERQSSGHRPILIPTLGKLHTTGSSQGSDILDGRQTGSLSEQVTGGTEHGISARSVEVSAKESLQSGYSDGVVLTQSDGMLSPRSDDGFSPEQTESLGEDVQSASLRSTGSSTGRRSFDRQERVNQEEDANFESDMSLPLSIGVEVEPQLKDSGKSDVPTPRIIIPDTPREETPQPALARLGLSQEGSLPSAESSMRSELTLQVLYRLLKFIQEEFPDTFSPETFYRSHPPTLAARKDIIYNSNQGDNLDHHDPGVVSMVILDELPLLAQTLPGECLLSDETIKTTSAFTKESELRARFSGDAAILWDRLFQHMTLAVQHNIMSAKEIAEEFVPCLVSRTALSSVIDRALELVENFLQAATTERPGSSLSHVSTPPASPIRVPQTTSPLHKASSPPPLASIEEDNFFSIKPPQEDLTQTAAYRNLLTGTMNKTASINDDYDSEDDIENQLAVSPQPSSERQKLAGVGIGGGSVSAGMGKPPSKDDDDSVVSSLSGAAPIYIPTAMDKSGTGRSTGMTGSVGLGSSGGQKKMSAAFRTGSDVDTDTEIDLPSSTAGPPGAKGQKQDSLDDDFDFYG